MIKAKDITIGYSASSPLLDGVSFELCRGELISLIGRNGAGKSTLMRTISGLKPLLSGDLSIDGTSLDDMTALQRAMQISLVTTERIRVANLTCETLVALGRTPYTNWLGALSSLDRDIVAQSLERVKMSHFASKSCDRLSDGELQRIMIARALAQQTDIIMLDEPTAFLDMPSRYQLMDLLEELAHNESKCIIFSTHELNMAIERSDKVAIIDSPKLHIKTAKELIDSDIIKSIFGIDLF